MNCILCRKEITMDDPGIIHGILWKGIEIKDEYIEISLCGSCKRRISELIRGEIEGSPIMKIVFKKYLKLVGDDILNFLKE